MRAPGRLARRPEGTTRARTRRAGLAALLLLAVACAPPEAEPPPSLLLVTLDTTRVDHLSAYGYPRETTPNLERLAAQALRYSNARSTSPWTLPAHGSLFTGLYPSSHGARADPSGDRDIGHALPNPPPGRIRVGRLPEERVTLAELLRERGYRTAAFVGGPWLERPFGLMQGFEHLDDDVGDPGGRRADVLTDAALAWLAALPGDAPYFLFLNYFDPHWPYDVPREPAPFPRAGEPFEAGGLFVELLAGRRTLTEAERAILIDRYDGEIHFMDAQLGRLLEAVDRRRPGPRPLVIVTADHGEAFGEGGRHFHTYWLSEELLRVPLLVRHPDGRRAGEVDPAPVQLVDVLPLVAAELGLPLPPGVEGTLPGRREVSLAEVNRHSFAVRLLGRAFDRDLRAVTRGPFKLVRSSRGDASLLRVDAAEEVPVEDAQQAEELAAILAAQVSGQAARTEPAHVDVDSKTLRALQDLGYVE